MNNKFLIRIWLRGPLELLAVFGLLGYCVVLGIELCQRSVTKGINVVLPKSLVGALKFGSLDPQTKSAR